MQSVGVNGTIAKSMQSYCLKIEIWDAESSLKWSGFWFSHRSSERRDNPEAYAKGSTR